MPEELDNPKGPSPEICRQVFEVFSRPNDHRADGEPQRSLAAVDIGTALSILHLGAAFQHGGGLENPDSQVLQQLAFGQFDDKNVPSGLSLDQFEALANELAQDDTDHYSGTPRLIKRLNKHQWNQEEYTRLRDVFGLLGGDDDRGDDEPEIAVSELRTAARALGLEPDAEAVERAAATAAEDFASGLDFGEFLMWLTDTTPPGTRFLEEPKLLVLAKEMKWTHADIIDYKAVFNIFDIDGDETIGVSELLSAMRSLGQNVTKGDVEKMVASVDADCSGSLDFVEFTSIIASKVREEQEQEFDTNDYYEVPEEEVPEEERQHARTSKGSVLCCAERPTSPEERPTSPSDDTASQKGASSRKTPRIVVIVRDMKWTAKQIAGFKKLFSRFDIDGDETVSTSELSVLFKEIGNEMDEVELEKMVEEIDQDGSGEIDFIEFLGLLAEIQQPTPGKNQHLRRSFLEAAVADGADYEFELKQLLLAIEGLEAWIQVESKGPGSRGSIVRASMSGRASTTRRSSMMGFDISKSLEGKASEGVAAKLLKCIVKVQKANAKMKTQEKLQSFVLEWCCPQPKEDDQGKRWHRSLERWLRFCRGQTDKPRCRILPASKRPVSPAARAASADQVMRRPPPSPLSAAESVPRPFSEGQKQVKRKPHGPAAAFWGWAGADKLTAAAVAASANWSSERPLSHTSRPLSMESPLKPQRRPKIISGLQIPDPPQLGSGLVGPHGDEIFKVDWCSFEKELRSHKRRQHYKYAVPPKDVYVGVQKYVEDEVGERVPGVLHGTCRANDIETLINQDDLSWAERSLGGRGCVPEWRKVLAERVQLKSCHGAARLSKRVPKVQMGKNHREAEEVCLANDCLDDTEMGAAVKALDVLLAPGEALSVGDSAPVLALNASGNRFTTRGLEELLQKIQLESLTSLDLSRNSDLDGHAAGALAEAMNSGELRQLKVLKLDGFCIQQFRHWEIFVDAMPSCTRLEALSLADTNLGRESGDAQRDCVAVAEAIGRMGALKSLDLAGNFFRNAGCRALGAALCSTTSLQILSLAGNAGGFKNAGVGTKNRDSQPYPCMHTPYSSAGMALQAQHSAYSIRAHHFGDLGYPPLQLFIEGMQGNACLNALDLSSCHLGYEEMFCLEGMAVAHPKLRTLLLADNPLGQEGLTCIVRLLIQSHDGFEWCDLAETRTNKPESESFQASSPSGKYALNLGKPYHRALIWRLLIMCHAGKMDPEKTLTQMQMGPSTAALKTPKEWMSNFPKVQSDFLKLPTWQIPDQGFMTFECHMGTALQGPGGDSAAVVLNWVKSNKSKVTLQRFVVLSILWKQLQTEMQLQMLAEAIRQCCVLKLSQLKFFIKNAPRFMVTMLVQKLYPCLESPERLALMDLVTGQDQKAVMREARNLFYFNPSNPMAKYSLYLANKTEVAVAERLITINSWQRFIAEDLGLPDTSQNGDMNNFRNTTLDRKPFRYSRDFLLPSGSNPPTLGLDYVSPLRPDPREFFVKDKIIDEMLRIIAESRARLFDKVLAVRILSHMLVLSPQQIVRILQAFPIDERSLEVVDALQMATQGFDEPRVEIMVMLFCRVADRQQVCSPEVLYNHDLFMRAQVRTLWQRLGRLNTFDMANICQLTPSNLGNRYEFALAQYETHRLMECVLKLAAKEEGDNLIKCWYSEASYLSHTARDGTWKINYDYLIPATWLKQVPHIGTIRFEYVAKQEFLEEDFRIELAEEYMNWGDQDCTRVDVESSKS